VARVDVNILKEIARIVQSRAKVPDRIQLQKRTFLITYLEDHRQRIEEALRRHDGDRLNMLFGQLESKVKYQVVRRAGAAAQKAGVGRSTQTTKSARPKASPKKPTTRHSSSPQSKRPATVHKKSSKPTKSGPRKAPPKSQGARKRGR